MMKATLDDLGGLSEAETEYAYRFAEFLSLGEERPDAHGFDAMRIAVIEQTLRDAWAARRDRLRRRPRASR